MESNNTDIKGYELLVKTFGLDAEELVHSQVSLMLSIEPA
ncbi:hypothetical protein Vc3S01_1533 [Vibrio campbellii]|nr:hypothetical protein Vc3S01_1533 [Vibrio campbellii]EDL70741.1 hypothetical protein A1Q_3993 [Vibrio campbellii HY01]